MEKDTSKEVRIVQSRWSPIRIILVYILIGIVWILISDEILAAIIQNPDVLTKLQTYKGWFFIAVTAWVLYLLINRYSTYIQLVVAYHKKSEEALEDKETQLQLLISASNIGLWDWDLRTDQVYFSPVWKRQIGYEDHKISNKFEEWQCRVHSDDLDRAMATIKSFIEKPWPDYENEFRFRHKDGSYRWILTKASLEYDDAGQAVRMVGCHIDITDRKQAEEELRQRNAEIEKASEILHSLVINLDRKKILDDVLSGAISLTGLEGGTLCLVNREQKTISLVAAQNTSPELVADLSAQAVKIGDCLCGNAAETGEPMILWDNASGSQYATLEAVRNEGIRFHAAFPLMVKDDVIGVLCLFARSDKKPTDRTLELVKGMCGPVALAIDNVRLLNQNSAQLKRLDVLFNTAQGLTRTLNLVEMADHVARSCVEKFYIRLAWVGRADPDGSISVISHFPDSITYPRQITVRWDDTPEGRGPTGRAIREGKPVVFEDLSQVPDFVPWRNAALAEGFRTSAAFPLYSRGKPFGVLNLYNDRLGFFSSDWLDFFQTYANQAGIALENARLFQEIKDYADELENRVVQRTLELEAKNRELETFSYSVSHDLKAPLRGIDGYSRLLLQDYADKFDDDGRFFLNTIRNATGQMTQLIDDLLAYSKLERRAQMMQTINPGILVEGLISDRKDEIAARDVIVSVNIPFTSVIADSEGLSLALRNLLDNALKFTHSNKSPHIDIGGQETENTYVLWVKDNGVGFDPKYGERIFDMFHRLHRAEDFSGTGHRTCHGSQGHGTYGWQGLGRRRAGGRGDVLFGDNEGGEVLMNKTGRPILLVEDNPMDVDLTCRAFKKRNLSNPIEVARDGEEALAYLSRWESGDPLPVVILLDLKLPKVGGLEVLKKIKEHPNFSVIPVVVLTTSTMDSDVEAAYKLGVNSYIVKPVDFEKFLEVAAQIDLYWTMLNKTLG